MSTTGTGGSPCSEGANGVAMRAKGKPTLSCIALVVGGATYVWGNVQ